MLHPRPTEWETLEVRPSNLGTVKFENQWPSHLLAVGGRSMDWPRCESWIHELICDVTLSKSPHLLEASFLGGKMEDKDVYIL